MLSKNLVKIEINDSHEHSEDSTELKQQMNKGRRIVIAVIATLLISELANDIIFFIISPGLKWEDIVRIILLFALCAFLYYRHLWARWIIAILCGLAGIGGLLVGLLLLTEPIAKLWLICTGIIYLACASLLMLAPNVRLFFAAKI